MGHMVVPIGWVFLMSEVPLYSPICGLLRLSGSCPIPGFFRGVSESGPLRVVHSSRHKWPGAFAALSVSLFVFEAGMSHAFAEACPPPATWT